jgi:hypothetical protein
MLRTGKAITASYQRRRSKQNETFHRLQTILCLDESADVLAYLRELLRHAGYGVLTNRMLHDAKILLVATKPSLIVLGPQNGTGAREEHQRIARGDCPNDSSLQSWRKISPHETPERSGCRCLREFAICCPPPESLDFLRIEIQVEVEAR